MKQGKEIKKHIKADLLEKLKCLGPDPIQKEIPKEPGCFPAIPLTGRFSNEILQFFYENDIMEV
jgi:hypothetical protein